MVFPSTSASNGRRRGASPEAVVTGFGVAVGVHVFLLLFLRPIVVDTRGHMGRTAETDEAAALAAAKASVPLDPSCDGDAMLRAGARALWCLTPFVDDPGACLDAAAERLRLDELLCHLDPLAAIPATALLDPPRLEDIPQIDPEPLLAEMTPEEMKQFEQQLQEQAMAPPPPPPPPQPPQRPRDAQVVENTDTQSEAPDDAQFLAEFDQKVDKQTVARGDRQDEMIQRPDPAADMPSDKNAKKPANLPKPAEDPPGKSSEAPPNPGLFSMRRPGTPNQGDVTQEQKIRGAVGGSDAPAGDGNQAQKGDGSISQDARKPSTPADGEGGGGGGTPRAPNLRPDEETLERIVGGGSVDHVEDVDEGEETAYNAKRWVYASFFNRMKRMVAQNWHPDQVWRREDPDGTKYGFKDRVTVLRVSLDERGKVAKALVVTASGVESLDDEAIRAFSAAHPFPNPPEALFDADGRITFDFGFYFTIDGGQTTSWKLYRGK